MSEHIETTGDDELEPKDEELEEAVEPDAVEAAEEAAEHEPTEEEMVGAAIAAGEALAADDFKHELEQVRAERDELAAQIEAEREIATDAADRLARLQADWENYRKRTATEREAEKARATERVVTNLLPAIDDLERAVAHAEENGANDEQLAQFVSGVSAVHDKILAILAREGVEVIEAAGQPFDPEIHQAVGRVEDASEYDETVRDVYQAGYKLAGRVIRPAMVTVTFGGEKRPANEE